MAPMTVARLNWLHSRVLMAIEEVNTLEKIMALLMVIIFLNIVLLLLPRGWGVALVGSSVFLSVSKCPCRGDRTYGLDSRIN